MNTFDKEKCVRPLGEQCQDETSDTQNLLSILIELQLVISVNSPGHLCMLVC